MDNQHVQRVLDLLSVSKRKPNYPTFEGHCPASKKAEEERSRGTLRIRILILDLQPSGGQRGPRPAPAQGATKKRTRCVGDGCIKAPALAPFEVPLMEPLPLTSLSPFTIRSLVPKIKKKKREPFDRAVCTYTTNRPGIPAADNGRRWTTAGPAASGTAMLAQRRVSFPCRNRANSPSIFPRFYSWKGRSFLWVSTHCYLQQGRLYQR